MSDDVSATGILARLDRLESLDEIRQLAAKYSLALDMRDLDALVGLFPEDIRVGKDATGRRALRAWFDDTLRNQFTGTAHHIGNHIIEFDTPDSAQGIVYSKNEHETGDEWVIMQMMYFDRYERRDGRWYFRRRMPLYWYATDLNKPPIGPQKMRWPGRDAYDGSFHELFPSWKLFWEAAGSADAPLAEPAPLGEFINRMRRGNDVASVRVR
ncbi:nuclear transport factor 2 family protein [Azospirillum soli]|uniref:nuclear transport factor 2 family protein n=1 Tax=Azospirillum soli TaxID=1304799 RepID=UPI001AE1557E|nr:nuclear transport factor 2 family protein [Azospirillum soli]MBP2316580.1 ketosteroid isomerase-like protein [Azospirillum soli]